MRRKQQDQILTNLQYDNNNQPLPLNIQSQFQEEAAVIAIQH